MTGRRHTGNVRSARSLASLALLASIAGGTAGCVPAEPELRGIVFSDPEPAEDFTLPDLDGEPFTLSEQRGRVVLLFFGFAHCPDVCPLTLTTWARVERALGERAGEVEFVFVTVDPERDDADRLREHLAVFSDAFVGLTDEPAAMEPVYRAYGILHDKVRFSSSAVGYVVNHTTRVFVIDPRGRLRLTFPFDAAEGDMLHDVLALLDET